MIIQKPGKIPPLQENKIFPRAQGQKEDLSDFFAKVGLISFALVSFLPTGNSVYFWAYANHQSAS
jgi:hypothetical protein